MPNHPLPPWIPRNTDGINNLIGMALMGGGGGYSSSPAPSGGQGPRVSGGDGATGSYGGGYNWGAGRVNPSFWPSGVTGPLSGAGNAMGGPIGAISNAWNSLPPVRLVNQANNVLGQAQSGYGMTGFNPSAPSPYTTLNNNLLQNMGYGTNDFSGPGFSSNASMWGSAGSISPFGSVPSGGGGASSGGGGFWKWLYNFLT